MSVVAPPWLGLMRWSLAHAAGETHTDPHFLLVSGADEAWLLVVASQCAAQQLEPMARAVAVLCGAPPADVFAEASAADDDRVMRARAMSLPTGSGGSGGGVLLKEEHEFQAALLEDLRSRVEASPAHARAFLSLGALLPILGVAREGAAGAGLRWRAAALLGAVFQSQPAAQLAGLRAGAMAALAHLVRRHGGHGGGHGGGSGGHGGGGGGHGGGGGGGGGQSDDDDKVRLKAFNALSCLVRAGGACESAFLADLGAQTAALAAAEEDGGGVAAATAAAVAAVAAAETAAAAPIAGAPAAEEVVSGIGLLRELLQPEEPSLPIKSKALFCLQRLAFSSGARCIGECIARSVPSLLAALLREGESDPGDGALADVREKALAVLLQLLEGDADGSAGARAAIGSAELGVAATLAARIGALAALTGEEAEYATEELELARRLARQLEHGQQGADAEVAAAAAAVAAAAVSAAATAAAAPPPAPSSAAAAAHAAGGAVAAGSAAAAAATAAAGSDEALRAARRREHTVPNYIDITLARRSRCVTGRQVLTAEDRAQVEAIQEDIVRSQGVLGNNRQNGDWNRRCKSCTFLNKGEHPEEPDPIYSRAPRVLAKMLRFAMRAWEQERWSTRGAGRGGEEGAAAAAGETGGGSPPLAGVAGVRSLSIRNVEHWHYDVGGHLDNDTHHDGGSIVTIVCALDGGYDGGVFRTFEEDGTHLEHPMEAGDCVCFVSHKYHNVTRVTRGFRHSMVIELWEGKTSLHGR